MITAAVRFFYSLPHACQWAVPEAVPPVMLVPLYVTLVVPEKFTGPV